MYEMRQELGETVVIQLPFLGYRACDVLWGIFPYEKVNGLL